MAISQTNRSYWAHSKPYNKCVHLCERTQHLSEGHTTAHISFGVYDPPTFRPVVHGVLRPSTHIIMYGWLAWMCRCVCVCACVMCRCVRLLMFACCLYKLPEGTFTLCIAWPINVCVQGEHWLRGKLPRAQFHPPNASKCPAQVGTGQCFMFMLIPMTQTVYTPN